MILFCGSVPDAALPDTKNASSSEWSRMACQVLKTFGIAGLCSARASPKPLTQAFSGYPDTAQSLLISGTRNTGNNTTTLSGTSSRHCRGTAAGPAARHLQAYVFRHFSRFLFLVRARPVYCALACSGRRKEVIMGTTGDVSLSVEEVTQRRQWGFGPAAPPFYATDPLRPC